MSAVIESNDRFPGAPLPPADVSRNAAVRILAQLPAAAVDSLTRGDADRLTLLTELVAIAFASRQIDALKRVHP